MLNRYYAIKILLEEQQEIMLNQVNMNNKMKMPNTNSGANNFLKQLFQGVQTYFVPNPRKELQTVKLTSCDPAPDCQAC